MQYIIDLTAVANAQNVGLSLTNVIDAIGSSSSAVSISMGVLFGDSNGDGVVNSGDALQTRNRSGQSASAATFRNSSWVIGHWSLVMSPSSLVFTNDEGPRTHD